MEATGSLALTSTPVNFLCTSVNDATAPLECNQRRRQGSFAGPNEPQQSHDFRDPYHSRAYRSKQPTLDPVAQRNPNKEPACRPQTESARPERREITEGRRSNPEVQTIRQSNPPLPDKKHEATPTIVNRVEVQQIHC
ncbi:hypothetical protein TcWFU_000948 [Taenia crassiceps]|uniref:Uncharacterized protein n=1 Tax=Taenia crassiceps TaxID=6207 RepID=A0ABR4Q584_9CEST